MRAPHERCREGAVHVGWRHEGEVDGSCGVGQTGPVTLYTNDRQKKSRAKASRWRAGRGGRRRLKESLVVTIKMRLEPHAGRAK